LDLKHLDSIVYSTTIVALAYLSSLLPFRTLRPPSHPPKSFSFSAYLISRPRSTAGLLDLSALDIHTFLFPLGFSYQSRFRCQFRFRGFCLTFSSFGVFFPFLFLLLLGTYSFIQTYTHIRTHSFCTIFHYNKSNLNVQCSTSKFVCRHSPIHHSIFSPFITRKSPPTQNFILVS